MRFKTILYCLALLLFFTTGSATAGIAVAGFSSPKIADTTSPVIAGDFADPSIVRIGDVYYAAGTSSEWAPHYPIYKSTNLTDWTLVSYIFPKKEAWMKSSFWAPELYYYNNKLYAYYTVRDTGNISCVGVATAESPEKGFTDHGVIIRTGSEAIDGFVYNDDGQLYITWKAYGLDKRPIELLSSKLSADGLKLEGETVSIMRDNARKGMEGQSMIKRDGYYYLLYSAGSCCGVPCDYNLRVSRSKSVTGPFEDYAANPVLKENESWMCTGHGTPVQLKDGRWFYLYHGYEKQQNVYTGRQGLLAEITWNEAGWPVFNRPASSAATAPRVWTDDFTDKTLSLQWTWDYRHSEIKPLITEGALQLSGKPGKGNLSGIVLCVRATSGNYEMATTVVNKGNALKGLTLYGDDNSNTGIALKGNEIIVWATRDQKREVLYKTTIKAAKTVDLYINVKDGHLLSYSFSTDHNKAQVVPAFAADKAFDASFTKQWDRSPRPGLIQQGAEPGVFESFTISYR